MSDTFKKVSIGLLTLFFGTTIFFYAVHNHCVYRAKAPAKLTFNGISFYIREITWENKVYPTYPPRITLPDYYLTLAKYLHKLGLEKFVWGVDPHMSLRDLVFFYSNPYITEPGKGLLKVRALVAGDSEQLLDTLPKIASAGVKLYCNGVKVENGTRISLRHRNVAYFETWARNISADIKTVELEFSGDPFDHKRTLTFEPKWETLHYFFKYDGQLLDGYLNPEYTAKTFIDLCHTGKLDKAKQFVLPRVREEISWHQLKHLKVQPGNILMSPLRDLDFVRQRGSYENVFTVPLYYDENVESNNKQLPRQYLFLIEKDGLWKIVHVGPLEANLNPTSE